MKYEVIVTGLGDLVSEMLENNICILFNDNAPAELAEISILHTVAELKEAVKVGDKVTIGTLDYTVQDVGGEANHTLKTLGHCTLKFGAEKADLPGEIALTGNPIAHVKPGDLIKIQ